MNDDDTLDDPEELFNQTRRAVNKQTPHNQPETPNDETIPTHQTNISPNNDETVPAPTFPPRIDDDETVLADKRTFPLFDGNDDETIDADPELFRRLKQQNQQPPNPPTSSNARKWVIGITAAALIAVATTTLALLTTNNNESTLTTETTQPTTENETTTTTTTPPTTTVPRETSTTTTEAPTVARETSTTTTAVPTTSTTARPATTAPPATTVARETSTAPATTAPPATTVARETSTAAIVSPPSRPTLSVQDTVSLPPIARDTGGRIQMSWSADDNGSPITRWEVDDGNLAGGPSSTATNYTWNNVAPGSYTITIRACNAAGCGEQTQVNTAVYDVPSRPALNVSGGEGIITARWSADDNGSRITRWDISIEGAQGSTPTFQTGGEYDASTTSWEWPNLPPGQYRISIRARNQAGWSEWHVSNTVVVKPLCPPGWSLVLLRCVSPQTAVPAAPTNVRVSQPPAPAQGFIDLRGTLQIVTWNAPASNGTAAVTGYKVQRRATVTSETDPMPGNPTAVNVAHSGTATRYEATVANGDALQGASWDYRVRATNPTGDGPWSDWASGTPAGLPNAVVPGNIEVIPESGSLVVTWTPPASNGSDITHYNVWWARNATGNEPVAGSRVVAASVRPTTVITGLSSGPHIIGIIAVNGVGFSGQTTTDGTHSPTFATAAPTAVTAKAEATPETPVVGLTVVQPPKTTTVRVTWTVNAANAKMEGVTGYQVVWYPVDPRVAGNRGNMTVPADARSFDIAGLTAVGEQITVGVSPVNKIGVGVPARGTHTLTPATT
ncbi:MAG: fibronectin type III domain-containing protein [Acidimicrobiia bacterium]|nr:fibronectin type III domain-containing protein [Acidimicrobiia bacterium]MCY4456967.1 fibronectin type III domain-containing protein [Acidimicrobiaceae bacterium]